MLAVLAVLAVLAAALTCVLCVYAWGRGQSEGTWVPVVLLVPLVPMLVVGLCGAVLAPWQVRRLIGLRD